MDRDWFKSFWGLLNSTVVYRIITYTVLIYFIQLLGIVGIVISYFGSLTPDLLLKGQVWRLLTYGFLHASDLFHVAFNMLGLWFFGRELEQFWGGRKFFVFYLFGIIFSGIFGLINIPLGFGSVPIVGASGAIYGVLFVYAALFSDRDLYLYFMIRIPVRVAVLLLALISIAGFLGKPDGVAHLVHLGGFVAGWVFLRYGDTLMSWVDKVSFPQKRQKEKVQFYTFEKRDEPTVDDILRKINRKGMNSLTKREKEILEEYSKRK